MDPESDATFAPHERPRFPMILPLSYVDATPLRWLSPGRLASGKLTLLEGPAGAGKSTLVCDWAARLSRGQALPGGEPEPPRPSSRTT
jgi:hypothetical protein